MKYPNIEEMKEILESHKKMYGVCYIELCAVKKIIRENYSGIKYPEGRTALTNLNRAIKYLDEKRRHIVSKLAWLDSISKCKKLWIEKYLQEMGEMK